MPAPEATAPYNFVRRPKAAVLVDASELPSADRYADDRYTGIIELTIQNETPLYIRGSRLPADDENDAVVDFFAAGGKWLIPGSSVRGMVRAAFEIVSWSKMRFVGDDLLFYRKIPEPPRGGVQDPLGPQYLDELADGRVQAGWIRKSGAGYRLFRAQKINGRTYFNIEKDKTEAVFGNVPNWTRREVWFRVAGDRVEYLSDQAPPTGEPAARGILIRPGSLKTGRNDWIVTFPDPEDRRGEGLDPEVVDAYRDANGGATKLVRERGFSVLPGFHSRPERNQLPAFCVQRREGQRELLIFGHTRYFRVPYRNRISEAVPANLKGPGIDLTDAVFGFIPAGEEVGRRGRVAFEDAELEGEAHFEGPERHRELYSPRPTSYQMYLEQPGVWSGRPNSSVVNWNDASARIRGTKLYWHRIGVDWRDEKAQRASRIKPLAPGNRFSARIRFENLVEHELGGLVFVLDLPPECQHKLGFGKPIGMGSIRITVSSVRCTNRRSRYETLFEEGAAEECQLALAEEHADVQQLKSSFAGWLLARLEEIGDAPPAAGADPQERLWGHPRMQDLRTLLDYQNAPASDKTRYMDHTEHKRNIVLPLPVQGGTTVAVDEPRARTTRPDSTPAATIGDELSTRERREELRGTPGLRVGAKVEGTVEHVVSKRLIRVRCESEEEPVDVSTTTLPFPYSQPGQAPQQGQRVWIRIVRREGGRAIGQLLPPPRS